MIFVFPVDYISIVGTAVYATGSLTLLTSIFAVSVMIMITPNNIGM